MSKKKIEDYTSDELYALARQRKNEEDWASIPKPLDNIKLEDIIHVTDGVLEAIAAHNYDNTEDALQYFYEEIMIIIYGKDIFNWICKIH